MAETTQILDIRIDSDQAISAIRALQQELAASQAQTQKVKEEIADLDQTDENYTATLREKQKELIALNEVQKAYRSEISTMSRVIQNDIKMSNQQTGSLKQLRAELSNLTKQYDELSRAEREDANVGGKLMEQIVATTKEIKDAEEETKRYYRNVGNYPEAVKPATQAIKELTQALIQMKLEGKENTAEYQSMLEQVGKMKDAMMDTQQEVKNMASDTGTLDSVMSGASATAGAFSAVLGAMNLVGADEDAKKLAEAQKKLQSAIAITTGLQAVQNATQKQSALMMGIAKIQTLAAAKAEDMKTAATGRGIVATKAATVAQAAFNVIANMNPYVLLATAILTVVGALVAFTTGTKEAEQAQRDYNDEIARSIEMQKELRDLIADLTDANINREKNELKLMKERGDSLEDIRAKEDEIYQHEKELLEQRKEHNGTFITTEEELTAAYEQLLQQQYDAQTAVNMASDEQEKERLQKDLDFYNERVEQAKAELSEMRNIKQAEDNLETERQITIERRRKEDAANAKKAADDAKKRREEKEKADAEEKKRATAYANLTATEIQKAEDAINDMIADEFDKRRAIEETNYKRSHDKLLEAMVAEEEANGTKTELYSAYMTQWEQMEKQHAANMAAIDKDMHDNQITLEMEADELRWSNKIAAAKVNGEQFQQVELEMLKTRLDSLHQLEGESEQEFLARKLALQQAYLDKKREIKDAELQMERARVSATGELLDSFGSILSSSIQDQEEAAKVEKVISLAKVMLNQGVAIAEAIATATTGDPYTVAIRVASAVASVVASMAEAIASINSAKFATGGYVTGEKGVDRVPAMLSDGESVMTVNATNDYPNILNAINTDGGGRSIPHDGRLTPAERRLLNRRRFASGGLVTALENANASFGVPAANYERQMQQSVAFASNMTAAQIGEILAGMPSPVVSVEDIARVQNRVEVADNWAKL